MSNISCMQAIISIFTLADVRYFGAIIYAIELIDHLFPKKIKKNNSKVYARLVESGLKNVVDKKVV